MRVIAGRFRGRTLESPPGLTTRPMTDRVKETIFNILGSRFGTLAELPAVRVLDLFAGTGGLGIEALSRGAKTCVFFERDRQALRCLRVNVERLNVGDVATVAQSNAWTTRVVPPAGGFGLVFIDPPYPDSRDPLPTIDLLERVALTLAADGVIVLRREVHAKLPHEHLRGVRVDDEREIGRMKIAFLSRVAGPASTPPRRDADEAPT